MVPSFFRSKKGRHRIPSTSSPFSSPFASQRRRSVTVRGFQGDARRVAADFDHDVEADDQDSDENDTREDEEDEDEDEDGEGGEDGLTPLLPIFEAAHLDALPVYNLTHAIRLLVVPRCETTLTWDQLRSPQISQFMVKPIQKNILTSHFSRATLYALLSNSLQFAKEATEHPGNSGTSKTRAMVCELLAIRLLKEYSIRELIDALSYDFFPLQGLNPQSSNPPPTPMQNWEASQLTKQQTRVARISTLEIAIRAEAKRFLAHPLVVQQLEAIWAGTIVFHSAADNAHRPTPKIIPNQNRGYGTVGSQPVLLASQNGIQPSKQRDHKPPVPIVTRRAVTLYDPRDASLFKLSRLRVPRYRSFFSTCSLAVLLGLFVAVLSERSVTITPLEVLFWFWSAGFMLDEVVTFTDQGFGLYLLSFWNSFDVGILLILIVYCCLRIFGLVTAGEDQVRIAYLAYDVLALNAILLFPRIFSVLDHYRYFSQLLIAFRMMARDLIGVLSLMIIACSGFFVAFTLAFGNNDLRGGDVAYTLFQVIMGFTPAAWEKWDGWNRIGQSAMVLFMFVTNFLVVTILISVLTNSFMAIVQNAHDEHQYVFAVNTISMVKSDALFSYIAPTNIFAWLLTPLRSCIPFRQFVKLNRTIIKITHFPLLFAICGYERMFMKTSIYEPADFEEQRGREGSHSFRGLGAAPKSNFLSPNAPRPRDRSIATHQDQALNAVFRHPLRHQDSALTRDTRRTSHRRPKSENIDTWFSKMGPENPASPPPEQDRQIVDRLERPRASQRRLTPRRERRNFTAATMSVVSDPEDFISHTFEQPALIREESDWLDSTMDDSVQLPAEDGDDEMVTHDEREHEEASLNNKTMNESRTEPSDYFQQQHQEVSGVRTSTAFISQTPEERTVSFEPTSILPSTGIAAAKPKRSHQRNMSTNTILYNPVASTEGSSSANHTVVKSRENVRPKSRHTTPPNEKQERPAGPSRKPSKRARPVMPDRKTFQSAPNLAGLLMMNNQRRDSDNRGTSFQMDLISDLGDNKAVGGQFVGGLPASFATHMGFGAGRPAGDEGEDQRRMSKLVLARMNNLEEGFREVLKEVKDWRRGDEGKVSPINVPTTPRRKSEREREKGLKMTKVGKKRKEGAWVEDPSSASVSDGQNLSMDGVRGSSL